MTTLFKIADYVTDKVDVENLSVEDYITTDNMLPNRNGITICEEKPKAKKVNLYQPNDILVSNIRPYFKKIWFADKYGGCSADVLNFRVKNEKEILPKFLYYSLFEDKFFDFMMSGSNGTKMPRGNKTLIPNYKIADFDILKQQKIVDILSAYDDLIENNQKQIKLLEEAAQRLYKEWFVDMHFPGYEHTKITDGIPEGWENKEIGTIIKSVPRTKQIKTAEMLKEGLIPVIDQGREFISGYTNDNEAIINTEVPIIVFGDHTRICKFIQFPFARGADGTQLIVSNNENLSQYLLYCSVLNVDLSNYHYARHFKYLKAEKILLPTKEINVKFTDIIKPIFDKIQNARQIIINSQEARDLLLPKLMSGEIEV